MNEPAFKRRRRFSWPIFQRARPLPLGRFPRAVIVQTAEPEPGPGVGPYRASAAQPFKPDGFNFPRPEDTFFDFTVRSPNIARNTTVVQLVFVMAANIKGGWVRGVGYNFNNPHGFQQVRTTLLVNGGPPPRYQYATVDGAVPATFQGSFPTFQIGTLTAPAVTYIELPSAARVELRYVNNSLDESFSCIFRMVGWTFLG